MDVWGAVIPVRHDREQVCCCHRSHACTASRRTRSWAAPLARVHRVASHEVVGGTHDKDSEAVSFSVPGFCTVSLEV